MGKNRPQGVTLIELLVVIAIFAILTSLLLPVCKVVCPPVAVPLSLGQEGSDDHRGILLRPSLAVTALIVAETRLLLAEILSPFRP